MKAPSFQLYPQDFISSLDCQMMGLDEFGAYNWLLYHSWIQEPQGYLPNDMQILSKLLRINPRTFSKMWRNALEKKFKISEDGKYIFNERLVSEARKQLEFREKQALNGAKGGRPPKKGKPKKPKPNPSLSSGLDLGKPKKSSSTSSSISTSSSEEQKDNNLFDGLPEDFIPRWEKFQERFAERYKRVGTLDAQLTPRQLYQLMQDFSTGEIDSTLEALENYKKIGNYTSVYLTLKKWIEREQAKAA